MEGWVLLLSGDWTKNQIQFTLLCVGIDIPDLCTLFLGLQMPIITASTVVKLLSRL